MERLVAPDLEAGVIDQLRLRAVPEPVVAAVADGLRDLGVSVATGRFGADMAIDIHADGPVTIVLDVPA